MRKKLFLSFVDALTVKTSLTDKALEILCLIYKESPCVDIEDFVTPTKTGACNTVTNLEHRAEAIYRAADLEEWEAVFMYFDELWQQICMIMEHQLNRLLLTSVILRLLQKNIILLSEKRLFPRGR